MASSCIIRHIPIRHISFIFPKFKKNNPSYKCFDHWTEEDIIYHDGKANEYATDGAIKYKDIIDDHNKTINEMFEYHLDLHHINDNKEK